MTRAALAVLMVAALACRDRERGETATRVDSAVVDSAATDVGQQVREGAADARDNVRQGLRELDSFTWSERDDFRSEVRHRLEDADRQIEQIANDVRAGRLTINGHALADIRSARTAVDRTLARIGDATADSWDDARTGVDQSFERLRDRIDQVTRTSGPMGGRSAGPN